MKETLIEFRQPKPNVSIVTILTYLPSLRYYLLELDTVSKIQIYKEFFTLKPSRMNRNKG